MISFDITPYNEVFTKERNEFFQKGGFRVTNYKHAKTRYNRFLKAFHKYQEQQDEKHASEMIQFLKQTEKEVDQYYFEAKTWKEEGKKPFDTKVELIDELSQNQFQVQEAQEKGQSLYFLRDTLYDPEFLVKVALSNDKHIYSMTQYLIRLYKDSLSSERPRLQADIQNFVDSVKA